MKTILSTTLAIIICFSHAYCQTGEINSLIEKGVELHDQGNYRAALEQYQNALKIDSKFVLAHYEMSSTYFALKEYEKSIEHSDFVISENTKYVDQAYTMKGSALDMLGKPDEAISVYRKGIEKFPKDYLLHYNLALTHFKQQEYDEAVKPLQQAVMLKPTHGSSHLLLGIIMSSKGKRVQSILALYNFLLNEPKGIRAAGALEQLQKEFAKGVKKTDEKSMSITLNSLADDEDNLGATELLLSLMRAKNLSEENASKSEAELFAKNTEELFSMMGEMKNDDKGFWLDFYVNFYYDIIKSGNIEAFSYYISQSKQDEVVTAWLQNNNEKIENFLRWYSTYVRKF